MIRIILLYMLTGTAAFAQNVAIEPWQIIDFVSGDFGSGTRDARAMLVVGADGYVDLVVVSGTQWGEPDDAEILRVPDIAGMVKYPPRLDLTFGGGFEISQTQAVMGWGVWTFTDRIAYIDGDYYYVAQKFEFTRGIPPFDSITCDYDYEYGIVEILALDENEVITLMEDYPISPEISDFVDPEYAGIEYEFAAKVTEFCKP